MAGLTTELRTEGDAVVVSLVGVADLAGVENLQRQLLQLSARKPAGAIFDLSGLSFISSICMGALVAFRRGCEGWKGSVTLAGVTEPVMSALSRARLDKIFAFEPSVDAALSK